MFLYLISKTSELISLFSCIVTVAGIVALGDYAKDADDGYKTINTYENEEDAKKVEEFLTKIADLKTVVPQLFENLEEDSQPHFY